MDDFGNTVPEVQLTERELQIARIAAKIAMAEMTNQFYAKVGKTFIERVLIVVGAIVVGIALSKGWVKFVP